MYLFGVHACVYVCACVCARACVHVVLLRKSHDVRYTAKLSSEKTFTVKVQNFHSWENFHGSMLVDLHCQSTRP